MRTRYFVFEIFWFSQTISEWNSNFWITVKVKPVKRSSSMSMSANIRKKSFGTENGSHNRMKTFKTFVTSKILSRSDLSKSENSLDSEKSADQAADSSNKPQVNGKPAVSAGVLKARDNFQRRSSRTSFVDIELVNFIFIFLTYSCRFSHHIQCICSDCYLQMCSTN